MIWPSVSLEQIACVSGGSTPKRNNETYWNGDVPWVTPSDLSAPGSPIVDILETAESITQEGLNSCSATLLPPATVLFSSRATIGKIGIAKIPLATNQGFANFTPGTDVKPRYLAYALRFFTPQITALAGSTTFKEVSRGAIRKFKIPLPSLSEQRRIIEILDQADALQRRRADADEKAQRILGALFLKMFGDPATNPLGWKVGTLADVITDTQYGISTKADTDESGTPILRMNNIDTYGRLNLLNLKYVNLDKQTRRKYMLVPGDILFNRTNSRELVGKTGLWQGELEAVPASYLIRIRVDHKRTLPEFVWAYMNTQYMKKILFDRARRAIGMANINAKEIRSFPLIIPELRLQHVFRNQISHIEKLVTISACARNAQDHVLSALMHRVFAGELTAKWRDSHTDTQLYEAEEQIADDEIESATNMRRLQSARFRRAKSC